MGTQNRRHGSIRTLNSAEKERTFFQNTLDAKKSIEKRRRLGQYATPIKLAKEITAYGLTLLDGIANIRFLEPAMGTGAFFSALLSKTGSDKIDYAVGFELDPDYVDAARKIWQGQDKFRIILDDFTKVKYVTGSINFLISNPPYVRYQYIPQEEKIRMNSLISQSLGIELSGLSGLYCYFMLLAHKWLEPGAVCGWLIPSEFMDVNYGYEVKQYLLHKVRLLRIHRYNPEDTKFDEALVSSCIVWFRNETDESDYDVEFSYGGTHNMPETVKTIKKSVLLKEHKWTRLPNKAQRISHDIFPCLDDFFTIKRGLATGDNNFFVLTEKQIQYYKLNMEYFIPVLPSPRYLKADEILADSSGMPLMDPRYFLLSCTLEEEDIKNFHPELWQYLQNGLTSVAPRHLCKSRRIWYLQETREPSPFLCTYMGRKALTTGKPFRFILNRSRAVATNSYLMLYPKKTITEILQRTPDLITDIWNCLKVISIDELEREGRVYGGGLKKIEPKELGRVKCAELHYLLLNK